MSNDDPPPRASELIGPPALILVYLLVILAINVAAAFAPLGGFKFSVNLALAGISVVLIGLFFMDLKQETPLNRLFAATGLAWLVILFMLIFSDYLTRA